MENLSQEAIITIVTIIVSGLTIAIGTMVPTYVEGMAASKALEGIARQPEAAGQLRTTMIIVLALLETGSIFNLLVVLILLFANPFISNFFGG